MGEGLQKTTAQLIKIQLLQESSGFQGLEIGFNRLGNRDTMSRYIYIHGTPYENQIGKPVSIGCIRMKNVEVLELFELIFVGTKVLIT